jgi:hypothetical protein
VLWLGTFLIGVRSQQSRREALGAALIAGLVFGGIAFYLKLPAYVFIFLTMSTIASFVVRIALQRLYGINDGASSAPVPRYG